MLRTLLLFVSFLVPLAESAAQSSTWWYPLGNPLGTRRNPAPTRQGTDSASLVVKWRSPALRNSPTILAGGIRPSSSSDRHQQVVGMNGTSHYIISDSGVVERIHDYSSGLSQVILTLTGLFNTEATSIAAENRPNVIGIGTRPADPADPGIRPLRGLLVDEAGTFRSIINVDELRNATNPLDKGAAVYPVTAYNFNVLVAVSQNAFTASGLDTTINSIRKYSIPGPVNTTPVWSYPIAPMPYPQPPAFLPDPAAPSVLQIGVSTSSYSPAVRAGIVPREGEKTSTDSMYSVQISDNASGTPVHFATLPVTPPGFPVMRSQGETHSYFMAMSLEGGEENFRVVTENHDAARPGRPRLWLLPASVSAPARSRDSIYGAFTPWRLLQREDLGLTVVAANIDGNGRDRSIPGAGFAYYTNNPSDELIAAYADPTGADLETNYLFALRRRATAAGGGQETFGLEPFVEHRFKGRLLAAGDLIGDATLRQELVVAYRDTVKILQLRDYDHPAFNRIEDTVRSDYFQVMGSFPLEGNVVSVAIADLEADGINDLIVTTTNATYAIGTRLTRPFGTIAPERTGYCPGDTVKVLWSRRAGGGQDGVRVTLLRGTEPVKVLAHRHLLGGINPANPGVGGDSILIPTAGLPPGSYRIRIEDTVVASLNDAGGEFTIEQPAIRDFSVEAPAAPAFGDLVRLSAALACSDSVRILRSYNNSGLWDTVGTVSASRDSATAEETLLCPADPLCGGNQVVTVSFRFLDAATGTLSQQQSVTVTAPQLQVRLDDSSSMSRRRTVAWNPADFQCGTLTVALVAADGERTPLANDVPASRGEYSFIIRSTEGNSFRVQICCADVANPSCGYGLSGSFEIPELPRSNYVAPNPYNPSGTAHAAGATIVYTLDAPGAVSVTIVDASRAVVRKLLSGAGQESGRQSVQWDGTNSRGEIVSGGTYICIIQTGSGEQILLPIIVTKR